MRALVVYESMYGSTHVIADNIADSLRVDYEVTVVPVGDASWARRWGITIAAASKTYLPAHA